MDIKLEDSWKAAVGKEFDREYMRELSQFLHEEKSRGHKFYPAGKNIFNALNSTPLPDVKAVIIGQDPYHGLGQAMGLSFSVPRGVSKPPSLRNIFKELHDDLGCEIPVSGDLTPWTEQGVMLLNATLTVAAGQAGSHQNKGWEQFTDKIIQTINEKRENVAFLLWGRYAQDKGVIIDRSRHLVLQSAHPSPFAARHGFFGSKPFSQTNQYLAEHDIDPIDWCLEG